MPLFGILSAILPNSVTSAHILTSNLVVMDIEEWRTTIFVQEKPIFNTYGQAQKAVSMLSYMLAMQLTYLFWCVPFQSFSTMNFITTNH